MGNLYYLNESSSEANLGASTQRFFEMWHRSLGHVNVNDINSLIEKGYIKNPKNNPKEANPCETCIMKKMTCLSFQNSENRPIKPLEIVHTDLCGPIRTKSQGGALYFITFTDDYSRYTNVMFLKSKEELKERFTEYKNMIENQTEQTIKALQSDNGTVLQFQNEQNTERKRDIKKTNSTIHATTKRRSRKEE